MKFTLSQFINEFVKSGMALILRGAPGSGKSTLVQKLKEERADLRVLKASADDERMVNGQYVYNPKDNAKMHGACIRRFIDFANEERGGPSPAILVSDNTNVTVQEIAPYGAIANAYGWSPVVVTVEADPELAAHRNLHGVPHEKVLAMHDRLQRSMRFIPSDWKTVTVTGG